MRLAAVAGRAHIVRGEDAFDVAAGVRNRPELPAHHVDRVPGARRAADVHQVLILSPARAAICRCSPTMWTGISPTGDEIHARVDDLEMRHTSIARPDNEKGL